MSQVSASEYRDCALCGLRAPEPTVAMGLVWWRADNSVDAYPRCRDRVACRERVEAKGEAWPVLDNGQSSRRTA